MEQDPQQQVKLLRLELDHVLERQRLLIEALRRAQDRLKPLKPKQPQPSLD